MVDKYLTCPKIGCGGVAERLGGDSRGKVITYKCEKCENTFSIERSNFEFGRYTFALNDPMDPMRGSHIK